MPELVTIRSRREIVLAQAAAAIIAGAAVGWLLQNTNLASTSIAGRLQDFVPVPLFLSLGGFFGVCLAYVFLRSSWNHVTELGTDGLRIRSSAGSLQVPYAEIVDAKRIPAYGVGIILRDFDSWYASQGQPPAKFRESAGITRGAWGVDVGILSKNLRVGPEAFLKLLKARLPHTERE